MELIDRIKAAEKGSRELDAEIALGSGEYVLEKRGKDRNFWYYPVNPHSWGSGRKSLQSSGYDRLPNYTTSLDAAMSLATRDVDPLDILQEALETARAARDGVYFIPLHVCAAAIKARQ